ncbi:zinc-binding dehydrogenase [Labilibaculum sp. A4]|uniref:NAD(P)-dependent alcohol dehydrogenase n=1 Tax=Labilibaculum euxinus TaxID=2686357 RepID=UPI000F6217D7|nr:NAD(P)-dependent alcohol dehydrogenase [Labilibaculum euxinus]MDQ1771603.1 NAD(P)-dependent alcohol dehydrogenase [Labilibaculum euxinus]MWN76508.1 zinc-binding dehydrogenase [Labilibaculum euxinus]
MKAVVMKKYGTPDVLEIANLSRPQINDTQVLVEVYASSVNPVDWKIRKGSLKLFMRKKLPCILGGDIAGRVVEIGKKVQFFRVGDEVFGKIDITKNGAYAEYVATSASHLALKPQKMNFEEAATLPLAGLTALQALRNMGNIRKGMNVLVNGCSGGVGSFAVQIAKAYGCKVTGVCSNRNVQFAKELGADQVVDYSEQDIVSLQEEYDIFFDVVGNQEYSKVKHILQRGGVFVTTLPSFNILLLGSIHNLVSSKKMKKIFVQESKADLELLADFVDAGLLKTYIDKSYDLMDVAKAHQYSETGRVVGKLSLKIAE